MSNQYSLNNFITASSQESAILFEEIKTNTIGLPTQTGCTLAFFSFSLLT